MVYPLSLNLQQKPVQSLKQMQRLIMSRQMQQAINLLQLPVMELAPMIENEMQQNPLLERIEDGEEDAELSNLEEESDEEPNEQELSSELALQFNEKNFEVIRQLDEEFRDYFTALDEKNRHTSDDDKLQTFIENSIPSRASLFEHLMLQAKQVFSSEVECAIAESIIGNLDDNGFLTTSVEEIALLQNCSVAAVEPILKVIKTFEPIGVGSRDLREALLTQLERQNKQSTLAYTIVEKCFDDLIHNRIPNIKKTLHCSLEKIDAAINNDIVKLDLHPATQHSATPVAYITADVVLKEENQKLVVVTNDDALPKIRLNRQYLRMLDDPDLPKETKDFICQKVLSAKWLMRNILQRSSTLERIAEALAKHHQDFFLNVEGKLTPLTMKVLAEELELHESTIARAVANKYIDCPKGLLPLRSFFTNALTVADGEDISAKTARDIIKELIAKEEKKHPLSDQALSEILKKQGINCARRTVAKYRGILGLGTAQQRRQF